MHLTLTKWRAARAGAAITVNGTGPDGKPEKIVGVTAIVPDPDGVCTSCVFAVDRAGNAHKLMLAH